MYQGYGRFSGCNVALSVCFLRISFVVSMLTTCESFRTRSKRASFTYDATVLILFPLTMIAAESRIRHKKGVSASTKPEVAAQELYDAIYQPDADLQIFYCSPDYDISALEKALVARFGDAPLIGCTSSGEITPAGYLNGSLTGVSIASDDLAVVTRSMDDLEHFTLADAEPLVKEMLEQLEAKAGEPLNGSNTFGFLLIDGLSMQEESVVSGIYRHLGDIQLFGGSAADGTRFGKTFLFHEGAFKSNTALFTLVHTRAPFKIFKTEHFTRSDKRMVVTEADSSKRLVTEINGEPAGREYARVMGVNFDQLEETIFATHPVMVRVGGANYVRSIMKLNEDESITFACAIDNGIVLSVAEPVNMVSDLEQLFDEIREEIGEPQLVLGCDCLFRHLEIEQQNLREDVSRIFTENNVIGFSTYGEQYNAMHVNQTFTGVAIGNG